MRRCSGKVRSNPSIGFWECERTVPVEYRDDDGSDSVLFHSCEDTHDAMQAAALEYRLLEVYRKE
jgi:hypothetical protein